MKEYFLAEANNPAHDNDWIIVLAGILSVLFVLGRLGFPKYNRRVKIAFRNHYEAIKLISDKRTVIPRESILIAIIPLFTVPMITFQQMGWFDSSLLTEHPVQNYIKILLILSALVIFRLSAVFIFGWLLKQQEIALRFSQIWIINVQNLGMLSLIPAMMIPFLIQELKLIALIMTWLAFIVWIIYTILRELRILNSYGISIFYRILYLCTLEILPLWWATQSILEGW